MNIYIKNLLAACLMCSTFFIINMSASINSYSVDKVFVGPSVIVASENGTPVSELTVTVAYYEDNEWIDLCELTPDENGKAVFEIQEDMELGTFYRLSLSTNPDVLVYAFVSANGEISYSKQFIESTCSLGDGASFKIKTLRDHRR